MELEESNELNLQFEKRGDILPVVVQEYSSRQILMLASVNKEAIAITIKTKKACFWSCSRNELWRKGETSGNYLEIIKILVDCDQDAIIYEVKLVGSGVCHTYNKAKKHRKSCFYRELNLENNTLEKLEE